jgi:hypothetical protein
MSTRALLVAAAALAAATAAAGLVTALARPAQAAQTPTAPTQLLFEQALADSGFHQLDASSAADIRVAARGMSCPAGSTFQVALYVDTAAGPVLLDSIAASCSDGVTKTYEHVVATKLEAVVSNRRLADGREGSFPVDVAMLGRP